MIDRIILSDTKEGAYELSATIYDELLISLNNFTAREERVTKYLYSVYENIMSGQFGLHLPVADLNKIKNEYKKNIQIKTPLWVQENLINGEPFWMLNSLGFGQIDPVNNRRIVKNEFETITLIKESARKYTLQVQNKAQNIINEIVFKQENAKRILSSIDAYTFEEIIAELLMDNGFDVMLTPKSNDSGRDIIAAYTLNGESTLMMVECKKWRISKTLGPIPVRALLGQYYYEKNKANFNCAMLVTTCENIGPTALRMEQDLSELSIKGYNDINNWMSKYGRLKNNLWIPNSFKDFFN